MAELSRSMNAAVERRYRIEIRYASTFTLAQARRVVGFLLKPPQEVQSCGRLFIGKRLLRGSFALNVEGTTSQRQRNARLQRLEQRVRAQDLFVQIGVLRRSDRQHECIADQL